MKLPPKLLLELHLIDNAAATLTDECEEYLRIRLAEYSILDIDVVDMLKYLKKYLKSIFF